MSRAVFLCLCINTKATKDTTVLFRFQACRRDPQLFQWSFQSLQILHLLPLFMCGFPCSMEEPQGVWPYVGEESGCKDMDRVFLLIIEIQVLLEWCWNLCFSRNGKFETVALHMLDILDCMTDASTVSTAACPIAGQQHVECKQFQELVPAPELKRQSVG